MHKLHNQKPVNLDSVVIEPRYSNILSTDNPEMLIDDIPVIWSSCDAATGTFAIADSISDSDTKCGVMLSTRYDIDEFERFVREDIYSICGKKPIINVVELD